LSGESDEQTGQACACASSLQPCFCRCACARVRLQPDVTLPLQETLISTSDVHTTNDRSLFAD
jgi:hypothetical protein